MATLSQKGYAIAFVKDWCNNDFGGVVDDDLPPTILYAVGKMLEGSANKRAGVNSKTAQGLVVESYTPEALSSEIRSMLIPYRKMRLE